MAQSIIENGKKLESTIDFSNFLKEFKKYRLRVLLTVLSVTLIATPLIYSMTPQYSATATMILKAQSDNSTPIDQVEDFDASQAEYYPTQAEVLQSKGVIEAAVRQLDLQHNSLFEIKDTNNAMSEDEHIHQIVKAISKNLSIAPVRFSQLIKVSYESTSPEMSATVTNAVIEAYIQLEEERKIEKTKQAQEWNNTRMAELKEKITQQKAKIDKFLKDNGLLTYQGIDGFETEQLALVNDRLATAKEKRITAKASYNTISEALGYSLEEVATLPSISNHAQLQDLRIALIQAKRNLFDLQKKYGPKNQLIIEANAQINAIKLQTTSLLKELKTGLYKTYQASIERENRYKALLKVQKENFTQLASKRDIYNTMKADLDKTQELYEKIFTRSQEQELTVLYREPAATLLDPATPPHKPSKPNKALFVIMIFVMTFILSLLFIIIKSALNKSINNLTQVNTRLGLQAIGELRPFNYIEELPLFTKGFFANAYSGETVHAIRTSILLDETSWPSIGLVSTDSKEGNELSSYLLAHSLSQDRSTLLIDLDFRKEVSLTEEVLTTYPLGENSATTKKEKNNSEVLPTLPVMGMAEILENNHPINDCLISLADNFSFLPRGTLTSTPLLTLSSAELELTLKELNQQFEQVIVHLPALSESKDAQLISRYLSGVIYTVQAGGLSANHILANIEKITQRQTPIIGVVLNNVADDELETEEAQQQLIHQNEDLLS
ncbi:exopolysaccharide transport family protein [Aliivibrio sp. S3MY1]|uniref:exopolysaccharide transport family protein n=1 Tax=unclassified Aliivibrio TaxID=2645654 RepID=UPI002379ADC4|nr:MULTISPECIES: exopolysaccharide transport family protein [unclassified Aliivibrio]MDD9197103.1 exopolysaccharide transport family protein [Aliivibrio sp. S3MY1]MDD9200248.1 exopolysaccharide transport family protein [Aliivibrio sp. S2MY1]